MDNMPEQQKCFGMFAPKYASYLIALFGLASGGLGIAGIILFALIENFLLRHFSGSDNMDLSAKKLYLATIGLTSILLLVANTFLFVGVTTGSRGGVAVAVWIILAMCLIVIFVAIGTPMTCFAFEDSCVIKKISTTLMVITALAMTIFLEIWLYFMLVARTYFYEL